MQLQEQGGAGGHRCDNGSHQVVPVPVLEGREVAMTSILLKKDTRPLWESQRAVSWIASRALVKILQWVLAP